MKGVCGKGGEVHHLAYSVAVFLKQEPFSFLLSQAFYIAYLFSPPSLSYTAVLGMYSKSHFTVIINIKNEYNI